MHLRFQIAIFKDYSNALREKFIPYFLEKFNNIQHWVILL